MVWAAWIAGILLLLTGILLLKVKIHLSVYGVGAKQTTEYQMWLLGGLIPISRKNAAPKKNKEKQTRSETDDTQKAGIRVKEGLEDAIVIVKAAAPVVRQTLVIEEIRFGISAGFSDPVCNGILFGALASAVALLQTAVEHTFVVKKRIFRAVPDFVSEEGIKIRFDTTLSVRPLLVVGKCVKMWCTNQEVRNIVKKYTKKEERE